MGYFWHDSVAPTEYLHLHFWFVVYAYVDKPTCQASSASWKRKPQKKNPPVRTWWISTGQRLILKSSLDMIMHRGDKGFMNRPWPLTSRLGSFSWHCHLQEHTSQRGFSPEDTESSLIILSLTNTEQQSEQWCYYNTGKMISHLFSSKKYL